MNCRACRAAMCTDGPLNQLRCAECRQIKFERLCSVALKAGLVLSFGLLAMRLFARRTDPAPHLRRMNPDRYAA